MIENTSKKLGWINGKWGIFKDLKVPINDRGLNFADGIFETIVILNGVPQLLNEHLNRWEKSASILEMNPPPSKEWLISLIEDGINRSKLNNVNGVIRINWTRGESKQRGIDISKTNRHSFWLEIDSYQLNFESISTIISQTERRNSFSRLSCCKTFSYNQGIQARIEATNAGFNDALLLNNRGEICCATTANILVKRENNWFTPPSNSGCLPGIMRQRGIDLNIIKEALIEATPKDNDEWFLINSLSCRPINKINNKELKTSTNPAEFWLSLLKI
ncbi:aminotransferase class IV [Prochlorococcus sp. MIT 0916]|uniref:Aminodeoxychorismate lyase n=1 Tax=Prochlorococcus marinus str. P0903-H212 TaxID=1622208 RepID=A0A0D5A462_PROMR|nr:Aminodeoxychorismate lyase [Prochlorococcus marinus str. P0903-H212]